MITSNSRRIQYAQTSVAQAFAVPFYFIAAADLTVIRTRAGVDTTLTNVTDYAVTGAATNPSTAVVTMVAGVNGDTVTIYGNMAVTQPTTWVANDRFPSTTTETTFDRLTMMLQQFYIDVKRTLRLPPSKAEVNPLSTVTWANKMMGFDANGLPTPSDPVGASSLTGTVIEVSSYSALRLVSVTGLVTGRQARTSGYSSGPDGGDGVWKYDSSSAATDNNGTIIAPSAGSGRWLRLYVGAVNVRWFGARGDGATDDTTAINAALAIGGKVFAPAGTYLCAGLAPIANSEIIGESGTIFKLKVLGVNVFTPVFDATVGNLTFRDFECVGQRTLQPADGFSDSFDGGANGTGRAARAAIAVDGFVSRLRVDNCTFSGFYGGCVVTRDVDDIVITKSRFTDTNFEGAYLYRSNSDRRTNAQILNCVAKNIASSDATVNANCFLISGYDRVSVMGNVGYNFERTLVKLEICKHASVIGNVADTNTVAGFRGIQCQSGGENITIANNTLRNTQSGILVGSGEYNGISITGNSYYGVGTGYGIACEPSTFPSVGFTIEGNLLRNVGLGVYLINTKDVSVVSNTLLNATNSTSAGILVQNTDTGAGGQAGGFAQINGNLISGFQNNDQGIIYLSGHASATFDSLSIRNNVLKDMGAANNRGVYGTAQITIGIVEGNQAAGTTFELGGSAGSSLIYERNYCAVLNGSTSVFGRILPAAAAAPVAGAYQRGDFVPHTAPAAAGYMGFLCVAAGSPGTWKGAGLIET